MRTLMTMMIAATLAGPAMAAQPGYERGEARVQTADLDLASAAGQRMLERRIAMAVTRVCGTPVMFTRDELADLAACEAQAMAATAPQIEAARGKRAVAVASTR
jgi:UrcA family protein